jgi:hypothetical protein
MFLYQLEQGLMNELWKSVDTLRGSTTGEKICTAENLDVSGPEKCFRPKF